MSRRTPVALAAGTALIAAWLAGATVIADRLPTHWAVRATYYAVAGLAWVVPAWGLMLWATRRPPP